MYMSCSVFVVMISEEERESEREKKPSIFSWFLASDLLFLQINHQPVILPKRIEQVLNVSNASPQKDRTLHPFYAFHGSLSFARWRHIHAYASFSVSFISFICLPFSLRLIYLNNIKVFEFCVRVRVCSCFIFFCAALLQ